MTARGPRLRAAKDTIAAIARLSGASPQMVLAYFSWDGRLDEETQRRISVADDRVLGLERDRETTGKRRDLHMLADFHFKQERGIDGPFALVERGAAA